TDASDCRVAEFFLDPPPVRAEVRGDEIPHRPHVLVELLGPEPLGERSEAGDVSEENSDLTGLALRFVGVRGQSRAALTAEREVGRHLGAAAGAARGELDAA